MFKTSQYFKKQYADSLHSIEACMKNGKQNFKKRKLKSLSEGLLSIMMQKCSSIYAPHFIYHNINIWMISSFRKLATAALCMQTRPFYRFADNWKDRDEASEKVFISQSEKETLKKLLKKVENDREDQETNLEEFDRKLSQIMRRYKIENAALASEIQQLHKNLK